MAKEEKSMKELINQMLRAYGLGDKLDEMSLVKSWEDVVGKMIARHTTDVHYQAGTLYVSLDSAPLRQELSYAKTDLIERLNRKAGKRMVVDLHLK